MLSSNLKILRERAGLSKAEVARRLNIPYTTYNAYEVEGKKPKYERLEKIAEVLNTTPEEITGWKDRTNNLATTQRQKFNLYLNSLGYTIHYDDPEHKPFIYGPGGSVYVVKNDDIEKLESTTETFIKYSIEELLKNCEKIR